MRVGALLIGFVMLSAACESSPDPNLIDGFHVGASAVCLPPVGVIPSRSIVTCEDFPALARQALDAREPGHVPIVDTEMHADGSASANPLAAVYVFSLLDGRRVAVGIACGIGGCAGIGHPTDPRPS